MRRTLILRRLQPAHWPGSRLHHLRPGDPDLRFQRLDRIGIGAAGDRQPVI